MNQLYIYIYIYNKGNICSLNNHWLNPGVDKQKTETPMNPGEVGFFKNVDFIGLIYEKQNS